MLNLLQDTYSYLEEQHNCLKHVCTLSSAKEQKYRSLQCRLISQIIQEIKVYSEFYTNNNMRLPDIPQDESLITITHEVEDDKSFQYSGDEMDSTRMFSNYEPHHSANEAPSESDVSTKEEFDDGFSHVEHVPSSNVFVSVVMPTDQSIACDNFSATIDTDQSNTSMEINTEVEVHQEKYVSDIQEESIEEPKHDTENNTEEESTKAQEPEQHIEEEQMDFIQQQTPLLAKDECGNNDDNNQQDFAPPDAEGGQMDVVQEQTLPLAKDECGNNDDSNQQQDLAHPDNEEGQMDFVHERTPPLAIDECGDTDDNNQQGLASPDNEGQMDFLQQQTPTLAKDECWDNYDNNQQVLAPRDNEEGQMEENLAPEEPVDKTIENKAITVMVKTKKKRTKKKKELKGRKVECGEIVTFQTEAGNDDNQQNVLPEKQIVMEGNPALEKPVDTGNTIENKTMIAISKTKKKRTTKKKELKGRKVECGEIVTFQTDAGNDDNQQNDPPEKELAMEGNPALEKSVDKTIENKAMTGIGKTKKKTTKKKKELKCRKDKCGEIVTFQTGNDDNQQENTETLMEIAMEANPALEKPVDTIENKTITGISKTKKKRIKKKKELKCRKCNLGFENVSKFTEHLISHRGKEQKPKRMPTRKQPDTKKKTKESTKAKVIANPKEIVASCPTCNKQFKYAAYFISHKCAHLRRPHKKKYRCEVCKKLFGHRSNLVTHKRIHSGEKPFKCDLCDGEFKQKIHLKQHYRKHTGEKPYQCHICSESFVRNSILLRHLRNKHS